MRQSIDLPARLSRSAIFVLTALVGPALGQTSAPPTILTSAAQAFSGGQPVSQVQLAGNATWYAGSEMAFGSATLTASETGHANMTLSLEGKGAWTESQAAFGSGMTCEWAGEDGVAHQEDYLNCLKPVVWFLPSLSLQPSLVSPEISVTDLGAGTLDGVSCRHLQTAASLPDLPGSLATSAAQQSTTDIGLDSTTLLPVVVSYTVHPDDGAATPITIEIRYSNYQQIDGAMIPFSIQRYVSGSLQLDIEITSAQIN